MMRSAGLHLRFEKSIVELIEKARRLGVPHFQSFLRTSSGAILKVSDQEFRFFREAALNYNYLFAHSWYTINVANPSRTHPVLEHEVRLASRLNFSHIILHLGSHKEKTKGIDAIARILNTLVARSNIGILLENVAFGAPSIGGALTDFSILWEKINYPEKIGLCIDTAHAHSYGYEVSINLLDLIDTTLGINKVKLIHLNNNTCHIGSHKDVHCRIEGGTIKTEILKACPGSAYFTHSDYPRTTHHP